MDIGIRQDLPKLNENSRMLIDRQKMQRDDLINQTVDYENRIQYLRKMIDNIESELFEPTMVAKIKQLRMENATLLIDSQCLSNHLDLCNQQFNNNVNQQNQQRLSSSSNVRPQQVSYPPMPSYNPQLLPMYINNQITNPLYQLSPHQYPGASRQISPNSPNIPGPPFYSYNRQGSIKILNPVVPPSNQIWLTPNPDLSQFHMHEPRRPSTLNLPGPSSGYPFTNTLNKPLPPPPTPPRPSTRSHSRSPNSSDMQQPQIQLPDDEEGSKWRCEHCTFQNHAALNSCEICDEPKSSSHLIGNSSNSSTNSGTVSGGLSPLASLYSQSLAHTKRILASSKKPHRSRKRPDSSATNHKDYLQRPGPSNSHHQNNS